MEIDYVILFVQGLILGGGILHSVVLHHKLDEAWKSQTHHQKWSLDRLNELITAADRTAWTIPRTLELLEEALEGEDSDGPCQPKVK